MSQTLTRRGLVKAVPAAAIAVTAPPLVVTGTGPDAELLLLAKDFERLHREWQELDAIAGRLEPPVSAHFDKSKHSMEEMWQARRASGYEAAVAVAGDKLDELDVVADRMRESPAQTLQGLAAKARLAQFDANLSMAADMGGPEGDWDWNVRCMERFVREIERFAAKGVAS